MISNKQLISRILVSVVASLSAAAPAAQAAVSERTVWQGEGWSVVAMIYDDGSLKGCYAMKDFVSRSNPGVYTRWVFAKTASGRWFSLVGGTYWSRMAGRTVHLFVDSQHVHSVQLVRGKNDAVRIGDLTPFVIEEVSAGQHLNVITNSGSTTYPLNGSRDAMTMTAECVRALSAPGGFAPPPPPPPMQEVQPAPTYAPPTERVVSTPPYAPPATSDQDRATPGRFKVSSTGTGFFVSGAGHIVTNAHVVEGCAGVAGIASGAEAVEAQVIKVDHKNDIALLRLEGGGSPAVLPWRREVRTGEHIAVFGFPLVGTLSTTGTFTSGVVNSQSGLGGDAGQFQLSAPVQPGNSGGAVLDDNGNVVGVVVSKMNASKVAAITGDVPQNVNFAIKSAYVAAFLEANAVPVPVGVRGSDTLDGVEIADRARAASVLLACVTQDR